jgi:tetratricopeptide (TPR) repeat protein
MKKAFPLIILLLCIAGTNLWAQTAEESALLKVAKGEEEAYLKGDSVRWKTFFVHDPKTTISFAARGFCVATTGWDKSARLRMDFMKQRGRPSLYDKVDISNPIFNMSDKLATVIYDQALSSSKSDTLRVGHSRQQRTLIKDNNQWKITSIFAIDTLSFTSTYPQDVENDINGLGYNFLFAKKIDQAIEIFKLNVKLYPNAWNPYDSLGEAYAAAGNKQLAIENYEKSLQLNPKNDNGRQWLLKLKK